MIEQFESIAPISIERLKEIISWRLADHVEVDDMIKVAKVQLVGIDIVLKNLRQTNENLFRHKPIDILPEIVRRIAEEREKLKPLLELQAN